MNHCLNSCLPKSVIQRVLYFFNLSLPTTIRDPTNSAQETLLLDASTFKLLKLRLICRHWDNAVIPYVFKCLRLHNAPSGSRMLAQWGDGGNSLLVDRLVLENLFYSTHLPLFHPTSYYTTISMNQALELLNVFGQHVSSLSLTFNSSLGLPAALIDVIAKIKGLKRLYIGRRDTLRRSTQSDSAALYILLKALPRLESLSLSIPDLEALHFDGQHLPSLKHFWCDYRRSNANALSSICQVAKNTISSLEYIAEDDLEGPVNIIAPLSESLRMLFIGFLPVNMPNGVVGLNFPRLRLIRCERWPLINTDLEWLHWPVFEHVTTIITAYPRGRAYWTRALNANRGDCTWKPPSLKHVVFTVYRGCTGLHDGLVDAFAEHDIKVHFSSPLELSKMIVSHVVSFGLYHGHSMLTPLN